MRTILQGEAMDGLAFGRMMLSKWIARVTTEFLGQSSDDII
jgi:hypothetical protein